MKGFILIDPEKCLACNTCKLECALEHSKSKSLNQAILEKPLAEARVKVERAGKFICPLQCRHCKNAPCIKSCPEKAIEKIGEGPVLINAELCVGCKKCIEACPFGVIKMAREGKLAIKCDLCFNRLKKGKLPACVAGCPTGALQFKSKEESGGRLVQFEKGKQPVLRRKLKIQKPIKKKS